MSAARAAFAIAFIGAACAAVLAVASIAPAEARARRAGPGPIDPSLGASFSDEDVARHGRFRAPAYLAVALAAFLEIAVLVVLARGPFARVVDALGRVPGGWAVRAALAGALVAVILAVASWPLGFVRGFAMQHAWGLSTQAVPDWLLDRLRSLAIGAVVAAVAAVAFFGVVRWQPRAWWAVGWGVFALLTAVMTFLWPVVVAPMFNTFTPLDDPALEARSRALAERAGVEVESVLVSDASRRTTTENAYVAGLGATKRLVLYDTLVGSASDAEVGLVVAHELGHQVENHVAKGLALAVLGLGAGFGLLAWLATRPAVWRWGGAGGIDDLRALPVILLFVAVASLVVLPFENAVSRRFERRADEIALGLTEDPDTAIRAMRRLAFANLSDLRPPTLAVAILFTHPPTPERIRSFQRRATAATP